MALAGWLGLPTRAQDDFSREPESSAKDVVPRRKNPSIFHRPAKKSPPEQWQYAEALRLVGKTRRAMKQYNALMHAWPAAKEAAPAQLAYATLLMQRGRFETAFEEFQYLIAYYAGQFPYEDVLNRQYQIVNYLRTRRYARFGIFPGYTAPERVLPLIEQLLRNAPGWEKAPELQLQIGQIQEANGEIEKAIEAYEKVLLQYPDSAAAAAASYGRAYCRYLMARKRPRDEEAWRQAFADLSAFLRDFPHDPNVAQATYYQYAAKEHLAALHFERAEFYDKIAKRPEAARIAYADFVRRFPASPLRQKAEERLRALWTDKQETSDDIK